MTPESSEQPRETRYGQAIPGTLGGPREQAAQRDLLLYGGEASSSVNTSGIAPAQGHSKVSSPELASLAAKYVNMSDAEMRSWTDGYTKRELQEQFWADVRRLAASVLAQAEAKTNAGE